MTLSRFAEVEVLGIPLDILLVIVVALGFIYLALKVVEDLRKSIPPEVLDIIEPMVDKAIELAGRSAVEASQKTDTQLDDTLVRELLEQNGWVVEIDGSGRIVKADPPVE